MQQYNINASIRNTLQTANGASSEPQPTGMPVDMQEAARAAERARLRQGIMHVRIRHFYCTLEEMFDPSLRGQSFVVGTGTGRPNEPGRVIDASPAAVRRYGRVQGGARLADSLAGVGQAGDEAR